VGEQRFISKVSMFASFVCHMAHREVKLQPMGRVFKTSALGSCVQFWILSMFLGNVLIFMHSNLIKFLLLATGHCQQGTNTTWELQSRQ